MNARGRGFSDGTAVLLQRGHCFENKELSNRRQGDQPCDEPVGLACGFAQEMLPLLGCC